MRYGPNRISINTNTALHSIYSARANVQKAKFYNVFTALFKVPGTVTIIDKVEHGIRRRLTNQGLTMSAIKSMEGLMLENIRSFCDQLVDVKRRSADDAAASEWSAGRNMTKLLARVTFDIVGDLCFGRNWNVIKSERNRSFLDIIPEGTAGMLLVRS